MAKEKQYKDIRLKDLKVGDSVYALGKGDTHITTIKVASIERKYPGEHDDYLIVYDNDCQAVGNLNSTESGMGMYSCTVYFSESALIKAIKKHIDDLQTLITSL